MGKDYKKRAAQIIKRVLGEIKPDAAAVRLGERIIRELSLLLRREGLNAEVMLGGSLAKCTHLKNDFDVDVFVRFNYSLCNGKDISDILHEAISPLSPVRVHGSRDYFHLYRKFNRRSVQVEVIPVLKIQRQSDALNTTDLSPLHVEWVVKHTKNNKGLCDEIRLVKQFCKATGCYGAESYIGGFSGYSLEILTVAYGGFIGLLEGAAGWRGRVLIRNKGGSWLKKEASSGELSSLGLSREKLKSPLIIVDPVIPLRNAAAALSYEKFSLFVNAAKGFLAKPSLSFFRIRHLTPAGLLRKYRGLPIIIGRVIPEPSQDDVAGGRALKIFRRVKRNLAPLFGVSESGFEYANGRAILFYVLRKTKISPFVEVEGPPLKRRDDVGRFIEKHFHTYKQNGRVFAKEKRAFTTPNGFLRRILSKDIKGVKKVDMKFFS